MKYVAVFEHEFIREEFVFDNKKSAMNFFKYRLSKYEGICILTTIEKVNVFKYFWRIIKFCFRYKQNMTEEEIKTELLHILLSLYQCHTQTFRYSDVMEELEKLK